MPPPDAAAEVADALRALRARRGAGPIGAVRRVGRGRRRRSRDRPRSSAASRRRIASRRWCSPSRGMLGAPEAAVPRRGRRGCADHADEVVAECVAPQPADQRAAALRGAAAGAERHRRADRAARGRGERRPVPVPRPLLVPLSAAGPDLDPREGTSTVVLDMPTVTRRPAAADAGGRVARRHRPRSARRRGCRRPAIPDDAWCGRGRRAARRRIEAALDIVAADPPLLSRGDATDPGVLAELAALAPRDATLRDHDAGGAAAHPARRPRAAASRASQLLDAVWISIDPPGLHLEAWQPPVDAATWGGFVLGRDGVPLAAVDPLGAFVEWRGGTANDRALAWPVPLTDRDRAILGFEARMAPARGREGGGDPRRPRTVARPLLPAARPPDRHDRGAGARSDARQASPAHPRCAPAGENRPRRRRAPLSPSRIGRNGADRRPAGYRYHRRVPKTTFPRDRFDDLPRMRAGSAPIAQRTPACAAGSCCCGRSLATIVLVAVGIFGTLIASGRIVLFPTPVADRHSAARRSTPVVDTTYDVIVLNATPEEGLATQMKDVVVAAGWADRHRDWPARPARPTSPRRRSTTTCPRTRRPRPASPAGDRRGEDRAERRLSAGRRPRVPSSSRSCIGLDRTANPPSRDAHSLTPSAVACFRPVNTSMHACQQLPLRRFRRRFAVHTMALFPPAQEIR